MAEPALSPAALLVRRYDPALFRTALFAPEPGRERLMTLYAFDVELSRALAVASEPTIALMRLAFWREVLEEARVGRPPRAHEVAAPLAALIAGRRLPAGTLEGLVEAREIELDGIDSRARFDAWGNARFGGLVLLAALCLAPAGPALAEAAAQAGRALAAAFALRTAAPMAASGGHALLFRLAPASRAALARGETDDALARTAHEIAATGLVALAAARRLRPKVPPEARPAFLPLGLAEPVLRRAARPEPDLAALAAAAQPGAPGPAAALGTLWRAVSGRW